MTPRTPQCEVFCPFLSSFEHSGVPEDFKSPLFQVLGFTPTLDQVKVATARAIGGSIQTTINNIVLEVIFLGNEPPFFSLGICRWIIHNLNIMSINLVDVCYKVSRLVS
jgi:hypothetical protein